ncbi:uncharacterized protein LOC116295584 [Actinia tenebrosa]|uniref:Uncharacterized protein LOC116295584 n=1 Tax=Actinia tenebrosa TaxID=6105 RepID=A0A6P8HV95_ACTTE|nr:uncharacterized protein LOC116295584 [Actinia tenebrosa]
MKHLWYSPVQEAPVLIDLTNLESVQGQGFLICYELVSCTTLDEYISKPEAALVTQIVLAIATDVINALSYLERCDLRHNHVTATNILVKESVMVPSLQAVLGGFGHGTFVNSHKKTTAQEEDKPNTDIVQYGVLVEQLLNLSPNADPDHQIKEISTKCQEESKLLTAAVVRNMIEEVWDGTGTWDTLL